MEYTGLGGDTISIFQGYLLYNTFEERVWNKNSQGILFQGIQEQIISIYLVCRKQKLKKIYIIQQFPCK